MNDLGAAPGYVIRRTDDSDGALLAEYVSKEVNEMSGVDLVGFPIGTELVDTGVIRTDD